MAFRLPNMNSFGRVFPAGTGCSIATEFACTCPTSNDVACCNNNEYCCCGDGGPLCQDDACNSSSDAQHLYAGAIGVPVS